MPRSAKRKASQSAYRKTEKGREAHRKANRKYYNKVQAGYMAYQEMLRQKNVPVSSIPETEKQQQAHNRQTTTDTTTEPTPDRTVGS